MNILFLEPFMGGSHRAFLEGLKESSRHNIIPVTMTDRHWRWRMNGGSVTLASKSEEVGEKIDLVLASSMTNLPAFIALTNPRFANTPFVMYMHENQLTMPVPDNAERDQTFAYINYLSALSAHKLIFSSAFHYNTFMSELPVFLKSFADYSHEDSIRIIESKSIVMHPGLNLKEHDITPDYRSRNERPVIVWNQRWEFDKNPAMFFRVMNRLDDSGCEFDLILAGDQLHEKPPEFKQIWKRYGKRILHYGYADNFELYSKLLHTGDIVVSTATYEFFCLAIMEAVYCGCHPFLPNDLTYPELIPESLHEPLLHASVFYQNEEDLFKKLRRVLTGDTRPLPVSTLQRINKHLDWSTRVGRFDDLFEQIAEEKKGV
jgi:glycosyltransferase involved in cell wall biosynthesis